MQLPERRLGLRLAGPRTSPIVVGSTLSLTGAFAATGKIHKIAGEEFVDRLNTSGGLLGRQVQWKVLDDQSDQAKVGQLYEQLISQDKVDLIIGPVRDAEHPVRDGGRRAAQLRAAAPHRGAGAAADLRLPVPGLVDRAHAERVHPQPALRRGGQPAQPAEEDRGADQPERLGRVRDRRPRQGQDRGARPSRASAGCRWCSTSTTRRGTTDWANWPQVRDAKPDLLISNSLGVDTVGQLNAMKQLGYRPPLTFSLFPAPGPLLGLGADGEGILSVSIFEPNQTRIDKLGGDVQAIVDDFKTRATARRCRTRCSRPRPRRAGTPGRSSPTGVKGAGKLDQKAICDSLHEQGCGDDVHRAAHVRPGGEQLLADHVGHQADPGRRLGHGLAGRPGRGALQGPASCDRAGRTERCPCRRAAARATSRIRDYRREAA